MNFSYEQIATKNYKNVETHCILYTQMDKNLREIKLNCNGINNFNKEASHISFISNQTPGKKIHREN